MRVTKEGLLRESPDTQGRAKNHQKTKKMMRKLRTVRKMRGMKKIKRLNKGF